MCVFAVLSNKNRHVHMKLIEHDAVIEFTRGCSSDSTSAERKAKYRQYVISQRKLKFQI